MFIEAILLSLIIGLIRGGKLRRFRGINHKTLWGLILGMLIQYILIFLNRIEEMKSIDNILVYTREIIVISYILILIGIITNIKFRSLGALLVGFVLNFITLATNGWKMPILLEGVALTGLDGLYELIEKGSSSLYIPISQSTKYPILGDIIIFSNPYPITRIISLGDMIISFGIFAFILEIMLGEDSFMGDYRW